MKCVLVAAAVLLWSVAVAVAAKATESARLIKLNVVALDAQGQPVIGLRSADFQLQEDGKSRDIAFLRFTGGQAPPAKPVPGEYSNRAGVASHTTVALIDLLSDRIMGDSTIAREITDALKNLESSQDLYLYILTPRGDLYPIHSLPKPDTEVTPPAEPWTRSIAPLMQAAVKNLFGMKPVDDRDIAVRFNLTVKALEDLGGQMAAEVPGRKNLVWVTHGLPIYGYSISSQGRLDFTKPLRSLFEGLQQAQVVVYTVEQSMAGAAQAVGTRASETLEEAADITGGREYTSDRVGDAIQQARTDSRANYEIAYYSTSPDSDGKHHKIRVTCERKDVRLQTEHGFYAFGIPSPGGPAPGALRSRELQVEADAAAHSPFDATGIGLQASVSPDAAAAQNMLFEVHIEAADLLMPRAPADHGGGKVSVVFASYDQGLNQPSRPIIVTLTPEQLQTAAQGQIRLREAIPVGQAVSKVRVIVFDAELGAVGSVTVPIPR
jgi:VWFA-related protein